MSNLKQHRPQLKPKSEPAEIRYLNYRGNRLPYRMSWFAFYEFEQKFGLPSSEYDMTNPDHLFFLYFKALEAGHAACDLPFDGIKLEHIPLILDEHFAPEFAKAEANALNEITEGIRIKKKGILRTLFGAGKSGQSSESKAG